MTRPSVHNSGKQRRSYLMSVIVTSQTASINGVFCENVTFIVSHFKNDCVRWHELLWTYFACNHALNTIYTSDRPVIVNLVKQYLKPWGKPAWAWNCAWKDFYIAFAYNYDVFTTCFSPITWSHRYRHGFNNTSAMFKCNVVMGRKVILTHSLTQSYHPLRCCVV